MTWDNYGKWHLDHIYPVSRAIDEEHLIKLMQKPDWTKLYDPAICGQLIHINNHYDTLL